MTVSSTTTSVSYTGDASTVEFPVTFAFKGTGTSSELKVIEVVISTGAETEKTNGTDYTVTGGSGSTGTVTATTAPAATVKWVIRRNTTQTQETDYVENDPFPAEVHEGALDRLTMIAQEQETDLGRTAQLPEGYTGSFDPTLPTTITADAAIVFNSAGDGFDVGPTTTDISNAQTYASNAATSATNAATSESNASTSETNAAASEAAAAASAAGWNDVVSVTSGTTDIELTDSNKYYILDASAGTITINMPAVADTDGRTFAFEVLDATNAITIARDGTDTINGVAGDYTSLTGVGDVVHFISIDGTPDDWSARLISRFVVDDTTIQQSGRTISVKDNGVTPAKVQGSINAQTGTTYTLVIGDAYKTVTMSNASANTLTIPTNASVAFAVGDYINVYNLGAGACTVTGDTGVTVNGVSAGSIELAQYGSVTFQKLATDTWFLTGGTVA